ncbi:hypothetical protein [Virgisporangium aurantiacum]|uniref:Uncharacterized protein n=1 Tax=Virgisporangium aurantiacum TaxID=175570 RepID=A0A8J3ZMS8_9ACTN|nr:hypothetical protein [Virgisporangium aurantiacum]GIJ64478.1 hypothetical protein Vau01_119940 [Virgisporangium aurantiacum]
MDAAIVAGLAALLGLAVGRFWDTHTEARRWRRDQRIRIYEQFAGAYYTSREAYRAVAVHQPGSVEEDAAASAALDLGAAFNRTVVAVWLHSSTPVAAAVHDLDVEVNKLFLAARSRRFTWPQWRDARRPAERAMERFTEAVRAELGLPRVPVTIHIDHRAAPNSPTG